MHALKSTSDLAEQIEYLANWTSMLLSKGLKLCKVGTIQLCYNGHKRTPADLRTR